MEKKPLSLKSTIKMLTFQLNFVIEACIKYLALLSLEKYLLMKICMIFQLITVLFINLTYLNIRKYLMLKNNIK